MERMALISDSYFQDMTNKIVRRLRTDYSDNRWAHTSIDDTWFANQEVLPKIADTVRGRDVFYIHDMQSPTPNDGWVRALLSIDAIARADANKLCMVIPCIPYGRQDRKAESRVPISAKVVVNTLQMNDITRKFQTLELHSSQVQGFFDRPLDNLSSRILFVPLMRDLYLGELDNLVLYSTDAGGLKDVRKAAKALGPSVESYDVQKDRYSTNRTRIVQFAGDPEGKHVAVLDDIIDTGGSMIDVVRAALDRGAKSARVFGAHGLFSIDEDGVTAEEKFRDLGVQVYVTGSINRSPEYLHENSDWLNVLSLDELFACTIYNASVEGGSISELFKNISTLQLGKLHELFVDKPQ